MKKLILIRHGETLWNLHKKTQGSKNIKLSDKGIEQGNVLSKRFKKVSDDIMGIYSSDLDRCYETAKLIDYYSKKGIIIIEDLREMNFGKWEGLTIKEIEKNYKNHYAIWRNEPKNALIPDAENLLSVQSRCLKAITHITNKHEDGLILVVSHGIAIKTIILGLLGIDLTHFYNISINNSSITEIEFRKYGPVLTLLNDSSHFNLN